MSWCVSHWIYPVRDFLPFLDFTDYFLSHVGDVFNCNFFKNVLNTFIYFFSFSSSSSGTPINWMLVHLILSQRSLRLSSIFSILFPLFCSSAVISTNLSSSSLIWSSASVILQLVPSRIFLILIIVLSLFAYSFFFSMSLVIVLTVLIFFCIFYILFASFRNIFGISLFWNSLSTRLLIFSSFIWSVSFYIVLSSVLYFSYFSVFS